MATKTQRPPAAAARRQATKAVQPAPPAPPGTASTASTGAAAVSAQLRRRNVSPDSVDFRDRAYQPSVARAPLAELPPPPASQRPVLHQGTTSACTGFALATCVHVLMARRDGQPADAVSPFMFYGMARRYDDLQGLDPEGGSTCRGVLKGWHRHGVCASAFWQALDEPTQAVGGGQWWDDAVQRPLGAYYRVDTRSVVDMQVALNEAGVLLASAGTHPGWDQGHDLKPSAKARRAGPWPMPFEPGTQDGFGHAFAIVGYTAAGFIVQNSWGTDWGHDGLAVMSYTDWQANAHDCWVAQLGVVTALHQAAAGLQGGLGGGPRATGKSMLDVHALSPHIINTGNDGRLSQYGSFHTTRVDIQHLAQTLIPQHRKAWGLAAHEPLDVALFAHGGLVGEKDAARIAAEWIPLLKQWHIFPVFFMWESGGFKAALDTLVDGLRRLGVLPAGGLWADAVERLRTRWDDRVERLLGVPARPLWAQMKDNARHLTTDAEGGARLLVDELADLSTPLRLHLIGHSAGAVVHAHLAPVLVQAGLPVTSMSLLAPALRLDLFERNLAPLLHSREIERLLSCHLREEVEWREGGMRMVLGYRRSLLLLVSRMLEDSGRTIPLLGLEHDFDAAWAAGRLQDVVGHVAPDSPASRAVEHGAFDNDKATRKTVLRHIRPGGPP